MFTPGSNIFFFFHSFKRTSRTSLVVQWKRLCLTMQGTWSLLVYLAYPQLVQDFLRAVLWSKALFLPQPSFSSLSSYLSPFHLNLKAFPAYFSSLLPYPSQETPQIPGICGLARGSTPNIFFLEDPKWHKLYTVCCEGTGGEMWFGVGKWDLILSEVPGKEDMKVKVLVAQLCPGLCDPMNCSTHQTPLSTGFF